MLGHKIVSTAVNAGLWLWGLGGTGQLGDGFSTTRSSPVQVHARAARRWVSIAGGQSHTAGVTSSAQLWAWGLGTSGQLGNNAASSQPQPVQIAPDKTWSVVSAGDTHSVALTSAGALWVWGLGASGQLGQVTAAVSASSPVQVASDKTWASVAGGGSYTVAITTAGALWAWGLNSSGQLAQVSNVTDRSSPVQIASDKTWSAVAGAGLHTIALTTTGTLWSWGLGSGGALGLVTTATNRSSPVQVASDKTWATISANANASAAITTTGALWMWGAGGQLGQITNTTTTSSPVQVASDKTWARVAVGRYATGAITTSGTLWTWGTGTVGQLGDSTAVSKSSPVLVGTLASWSRVAAGGSHLMAINQ